MGLIGKLGLIGIVAVAVILAVVWDIHNQSKIVAREKAAAAETLPPSTAQTSPTDSVASAGASAPQIPPAEPAPLTTASPIGPAASEPVVTAAPVQPRRTESRPTAPAQTTAQKYVTKKGDTLSSLAKRFYGDDLKWKAIYEANREAIPNPNFLPLGKEVTIPPVETAEKLTVLDHPTRTTYIVQKDDTLTKIAERHYGDPARWKDILEANKGKIPDKDKVFPGTVLVIPNLSPER